MVPEINLLPKMERRKSTSILKIFVIALVPFLIFAYLVSQYFLLSSNLKTVGSLEQQAIVEKELLVQEVSASKPTGVGSLQSSVTFVESISYPVSPLIIEIDNKLPENTYLRNYQFGQDGVLVTADFETMSSISAFVSTINTSSYFKDAKIEQIDNFRMGSETEADAAINFNVIPRFTSLFSFEIDADYLRNGVTIIE